MNEEKPPIGIKPYYIFLEERMNALIEAIDRADYPSEETQLWIDELRFHNFAMIKLREFEKTLFKNKGKAYVPRLENEDLQHVGYTDEQLGRNK